MKTDAIFYQLFKEFPNIFFELIGKPETNIAAYQFDAPSVKQRTFSLDGVFSTVPKFESEPLYFLEVQCYKEDDFYARNLFVLRSVQTAKFGLVRDRHLRSG